MQKKLITISLLLLLAGCSTTLNEKWTNFRAYYNTYYNAELNYEAGLNKVQNQEIEINIDRPIRVHPRPLSAGDQDFAKAIEKGAQILRKFPESKWIDETLELIGKSYYYRKEYYSALKKFEEQYSVTGSSAMKQRAVIWKARVLLELELYEEGIRFLEEELETLAGEWRDELQGEAQVLMAEHHVRLRNWEVVQNLLSSALNKLEKGPLKSRTYFLYGQILEVQERYGEANFAYANVILNVPEFELLYWARKKQGETFRQMGNLDHASAIYEAMKKDDKNVQRLSEINYEIARTEEAKGNYRKAEKQYKQILRNKNLNTPQSTRAKIYYRLGTINREHYRDYQLAASYFDSSSTYSRGSVSGQLADERDAESLASAYGEYATYRKKIVRIDSLLWLGSLSQSRFDSVINEIRTRKLRDQEEKRQGSRKNVLNNVRENAVDSYEEQSASSRIYGFLNYRNSSMVAEARNQFRAVWGTRALVDDWRRIEAVRNRRSSDDISERTGRSQTRTGQTSQAAAGLQIDISEVPFTEEQKKRKRSELATAKYELGNLFMLTLQMPDSSDHYFRSIVEEHPGHSLVPKALYSLFELHWSSGSRAEAEQWADRLRNEYPGSIYTYQANERMGVFQDGEMPSDSVLQELPEQARTLLAEQSAPPPEIAEKLRSLALSNKEAAEASQVHYEAIKLYIDLAKKNHPPLFASRPSESDSSVTLIRGSYVGAFWDSVRTVLNEHKANFPGAPTTKRAAKLSEELSDGDGKPVPGPGQSCRELGVTPRIKGGRENFLSAVVFPEKAVRGNNPEEIAFDLLLSPDGKVLSYRLHSVNIAPGIKESLEQAIEERLEFLPLGPAEPSGNVRCEVTFSIR